MAEPTKSEIVNAHRYLYYVKLEPVIQDYEYDQLEEALPDGDPVKEAVGSEIDASYPRAIKRIALKLWKEHNNE